MNDLYSVYFVNALTGWAVGYGGVILKTINGGSNWLPQSAYATTLYSVCFFNTQIGWAVGNNGMVLKTINGGKNWVLQNSGTLNHLHAVQFMDDKMGWAVGNFGTILKTVDGGINWEAQTSGTNQPLSAVHFIDALTGWAVDGNTVLKTTDGGTSWVSQDMGAIARSMNDVCFINAQTGWMTGTGGTILKFNPNCANSSQCPSDSLALVALYTATNGPTAWFNKWNLNAPVKTWYGISTNAQGCVTKIDLDGIVDGDFSFGGGNNLTGVLPPEIGNLAELQMLCIAHNKKLTGNIPAELGNLPKLQYFYAHGDSLSGAIPAALGNLKELIYLQLGYNNLSNSIPSELGNLGELVWLNLMHNQLNGSIPPALDGLVNLEQLWLFENNLTGTLPPELGKLKKLTRFWAYSNQLTGPIPPQFGSLTNLRRLYLHNNNLSGCFPNELLPICSLGFSTDIDADGYNFTNNPKLPWQGDFKRFCDGETQAGATCDDGNAVTANDVMGNDCTCAGVSTCDITITNMATTGLSGSFTLSGGLPQTNGSNYSSVTMALQGNPAVTATLTTAPFTHNATVSFICPQAGTYTVVATDAGGCSGTGTVVVTESGGGNGPGLPAGDCWTWQNPLPQGNDLYTVHFIDQQTGWTVGYHGTILKTINGGQTWVTQTSGTSSNLVGVIFVDHQTGWAAGHDGVILKTTNGGQTWAKQLSGTTKHLNYITFIDPQTGWVAGDQGTILKTTDGGITWNPQTSGTTNYLNCIYFLDSQNGWAVGTLFTTLRTTDGGQTWSKQTSGVQALYHVFFTDSQTGWASGGKGIVLKSTDGGQNWSFQTSGTTNALYCVHFTDSQTGWVSGVNGTILHTTNGGINWNAQTSGSTNFLSGIYSINGQDAWAVGENGAILKTADGGTNWAVRSSGISNWLYSVHFTDVQTGWAVGPTGTILKTANGGANWATLTSGTINSLESVHFTDAQTGWAVGDFGTILKTINGGANWATQTSGTTNHLQSVHFMDTQTGWVVGEEGAILKTVNGGANWATLTSGTNDVLYSVHFTDVQTGWAVGRNGTILKTINGGTNWVKQTSGTTDHLQSVHFTDTQTGWAVGYFGTILKTINGGANWVKQTSGTNSALLSVHFTDAQTGWVVGGECTILKTVNGGANWAIITAGCASLQSVHFVNAQTGWAVGLAGAILKYTPSTPSCLPTIPLHLQTNIPTTAAITWPPASGCEDGYRLSLGTTPGGSELLNNQAVSDTFYQPTQALPTNTKIYVRITPYNGAGDASGCAEFNFTTAGPVLHQRRVLVEEFTQASSPPDAGQNLVFNAVLAANADKITAVKYHVSWPGCDPMNKHNPTEVADRVSFCGVTGAPNAFLNGVGVVNDCGAFTNSPVCVDSVDLTNENNKLTPVTIDISHTVAPDFSTVMVTVKVRSDAAISGNFHLRTAITEEAIYFPAPPGDNGEKDFTDVMKKMLPDANGAVTGSFSAGEEKTFTFTWKPENFYNLNRIKAVAWLQDDDTKEVWQSNFSAPNTQGGGGNIANVQISAQTICTSNWVPTCEIKNTGSVVMTRVDFEYNLNGGAWLPYQWIGQLNPNSTTQVTLPDIVFAQPGAHQVKIRLIENNTGTPLNQADGANTVLIQAMYTTKPLPVIHDFEGAIFPPDGFGLNNEGSCSVYGWTSIPQASGGYNASAKSLACEFFKIPKGKTVDLYLPRMDLSGVTGAKLTFDHAATAGNADRLVIEVSTDCGATWATVFDKQGNALATAPFVASLWLPASGDWISNEIDFTPYAGQSEVLVRLRGISDFGNNLYMDNIAVTNSACTAPTATATGGALTCAAPTLTLTGSSSLPATYAWSGPNGFTAATPSPTATIPGLYTVTVTASPGCTATATATVDNQQLPPVAAIAAPQGLQLDCNTTALPLQASGGNAYAWSGPNGFIFNAQQPTVNSLGAYTVTVSDTVTGCTATATVAIAQDIAPPGASASAQGSISCTQSNVGLLGSSPTSGVTYAWSGPNGFTFNGQGPLVNSPGAYTLTVRNPQNGCSSTNSVTVSGSVEVPVAATTGGAVDCQVDSVTLAASSSIANSSYAWAGPNGFTAATPSPTASSPGLYTVTVTASPGCTATATAIIADNRQLPNVSATGGILPCGVGASVVLQGASSTPGVTYAWSGPNGFSFNGQQPSVSNPGAYTLVATNPSNHCTASATASATPATSPQAAILGAKPICPSQSIPLSAAGGTDYQWQKPDGTLVSGQVLTANQTGTYTVTVTDANNCTATATALITPAPPLSVNIAGATAFCPGGNTTLSASAGSQYLWNGPSGLVFTGQQPVVNVPGVYSVTVTDAAACTGSASTLVSQYPAPTAQLLFSENSGTPGDGVVCSGDAVAFTAGGGTAYQFWVNGEAQGAFSAINTLNLSALTADVTVRVRVENVNQCQDSTQIGDGAGFEPLSIAVIPALNLGAATLSRLPGCPEDPVNLLISASNIPSGAYAARWQLDNLPAQTTSVAFSQIGGGVAVATLSLGVLPPGLHSCKVLSLGLSGTGCATAWSSNNVLNFEVLAPIQRALDTTICVGQVLAIGGKTYGQTGNYAPVLSAVTGCDSTILLKLTVVQQIVQTRQARFCYQDCYSFYGQLLCKSGFYEKTVPGPYCDSLIRLELSEELPAYHFKTVTICPGASYSVGDSVFYEPGGHEIRLKSVYGCDSIVILTLKVHPFAAAFATDALRICRDEQTTLAPVVKNCPNCQYKWNNGATLPGIVASPPATTQYWVQVSMKEGPLMCVLRDTLELVVVQPFSQTRDTLLCPGEKLFGFVPPADTVLVSKGFTAEGCDSTVTLKVKVFNAKQFDAVRDQVLMPPKETRLTVEVTKNDTRPNGALLELRRGPQHGTAEKQGEDNIRYTLSDPDFFGADSVLYALCPPGDCPDACDSAWMVVRIQAGSIEQAIQWIPNLITPNGDGQNDFWDPLKVLENNGIVVEEADLSFFNRWGEVVRRIRSDAYPAGGWDGAGNRELPQATYYWILRVRSGKEYVFKGAVNLLK